jgi:hypothetical protein
MADVKFVDGLWLIKIPKGLVALTDADMKAALKRGKAYRRREQLKKRLTVTGNEKG